MKKLTALLLAIVLLCSALIGCKQEATEEKDQTETDQDAILTEYDYSDTQHGFNIKGKKYYYKGHEHVERYPAGEVLILNVTNETTDNYEVSLAVSYFDQNGEKIKTERQEFQYFSAGYQRYFIFYPEVKFDSYTCELELGEYIGEPFFEYMSMSMEISSISRIDIPSLKKIMVGDYTKYPTILLSTIVRFKQARPKMILSYRAIVFNNIGEIYTLYDWQGTADANKEPSILGTSRIVSQICELESDIEIPQELQGEVSIIWSPTLELTE